MRWAKPLTRAGNMKQPTVPRPGVGPDAGPDAVAHDFERRSADSPIDARPVHRPAATPDRSAIPIADVQPRAPPDRLLGHASSTASAAVPTRATTSSCPSLTVITGTPALVDRADRCEGSRARRRRTPCRSVGRQRLGDAHGLVEVCAVATSPLPAAHTQQLTPKPAVPESTRRTGTGSRRARGEPR